MRPGSEEQRELVVSDGVGRESASERWELGLGPCPLGRVLESVGCSLLTKRLELDGPHSIPVETLTAPV